MSVRRNIAANYLGQFYSTAVNIFAVPMYYRYMGAEAYGLVGFFALMQTWFQILDLGLTPTLAREMARYRGRAIDAIGIRRVLRAVECIFYCIAVVGAVGLFAVSGLVAKYWLKVETLPLDEVSNIIGIMGLVVALRWVASIYRSAISGLEEQVWLNGFNVVLATLRSVCVIPILASIDHSLWTFFLFQLVVAVLELIGLVVKTRVLMPAVTEPIGWSLNPLRGIFTFSLTIAFTAMVWVLVTQTDKLVLSKFLTLSDFGTFSLGVLAASAVNLVGGPISQALLPRMTKLFAEGDEVGLFLLYRRATQLVSAVAAPVALTLALFAEPILWVWTGNRETAREAAPILELYALGNGLLAVAAFQYYLQYAKGNLRLHLIGNVFFVIILVPCLIWAARTYGGVGAGVVWVSQCATYLLIWTWIVHRKVAPGMHWHWVFLDVLPVWFAVAVAGVGAHWFQKITNDPLRGRIEVAVIVGVCGVGLATAAALTTRDGRATLTRLRQGRPIL